MELDASDVIIGLLVAVFGIMGLFLAAGSVDDGMYVFGLALFAFAVLFEFGILRRALDRADAAVLLLREGRHHG
jgi:hypothetical protein